jgi:predicted DNA-binding transcriptional regulator AlpA
MRLMHTLSSFDSLPSSGLISIRVICALFDRSTASIWRDVKDGRLAKPIRWGGSARWRVGDIRAAMEEVARG